MQALLLAIPPTSAALIAKAALIFVLPARPDTSSMHQHAYNAHKDSTQRETTLRTVATARPDAKFAPIILPITKSPAVAAPPAMDIPTVPVANARQARLQRAVNQSAAQLAAAPAKEYNV